MEKTNLDLINEGYTVIEHNGHKTSYILVAPLQRDVGIPVTTKEFKQLKKDKVIGFYGYTDEGNIQYCMIVKSETLIKEKRRKDYGMG